ncbi:uncharacterized protein [Montipora foliosa]|uniref:uncharacterized protein n=1 Tax=Montipora foliosa TaxID=591990 RepID=UPI0035F18D8B
MDFFDAQKSCNDEDTDENNDENQTSEESTSTEGQVSESLNIYACACADGMFEQEREMQYLQTWLWSDVPNEPSRDFGPCDRFWTQLALRSFLLPTSPPGTA